MVERSTIDRARIYPRETYATRKYRTISTAPSGSAVVRLARVAGVAPLRLTPSGRSSRTPRALLAMAGFCGCACEASRVSTAPSGSAVVRLARVAGLAPLRLSPTGRSSRTPRYGGVLRVVSREVPRATATNVRFLWGRLQRSLGDAWRRSDATKRRSKRRNAEAKRRNAEAKLWSLRSTQLYQ